MLQKTGLILVVLGTLALARTIWLLANYQENMADETRQRGYILIALALCMIATGAVVAYRFRRRT